MNNVALPILMLSPTLSSDKDPLGPAEVSQWTGRDHMQQKSSHQTSYRINVLLFASSPQGIQPQPGSLMDGMIPSVFASAPVLLCSRHAGDRVEAQPKLNGTCTSGSVEHAKIQLIGGVSWAQAELIK